jgi:hypothetical protein
LDSGLIVGFGRFSFFDAAVYEHPWQHLRPAAFLA